MRVSTYEKFLSTTYYFSKIQNEAYAQQVKIGTGKNFEYMSEDPIGANKLTFIKNAESSVTQYQKNTTDASSYLSIVENVYSNAENVLQTVREKGLQASNDTYSQTDRNVIIKEIDQSIEQLVSLANSKHLNQYLFSGERTDTPPIDYTGGVITYNGNAVEKKMKISPYLNVSVSSTADQTFQPVLEKMIDLRNQIATGDAALIGLSLEQYDLEMDNFIDKKADIGTKMAMVRSVDESYYNTSLELAKQKTGIEDVDFPKLLSEFASTQQLYQANIQASLKTMELSILNYM